jgi:mono/diheme cytochrome c family protein
VAFVEGSSLVRRTAILFGGIAVLALLLTPTTGTAASRRATALAAQQQPADSPALNARGRELYQQACASCHGEQDIRALVVYVGKAVGDAQIPDVDPARGNLQRGRQLYGQACAACHGMNGAGAALGGQNIAVSLQGVEPIDVAEAIKIGPGQMPVGGGLADYEFGTAQSTQEVDDIAAYVESLQTRPYNRGGAPIGGKGPVPEGFVAWVIGLGILVVAARWIAGRGGGA